MSRALSLFFVVLLGVFGITGCEGCDDKDKSAKLPLPFEEDFDRRTLGKMWRSDMSGRWRIRYDEAKNDGRLCVEQARNNPLFLQGKLPRDVVVEFDAWAHERTGDVKIELFTDGHFHASGYVLVHGGWNNSTSIIDRLDEHNRNCKTNEHHQSVHCRRWRMGLKGSSGKRLPIVQKDKKYRWRVERSDSEVRWYIDGKLYMKYIDPAPLEGKGNEFFAFSNWIAYSCFDNLSIRRWEPKTVNTKTAPAPRKAAPLPVLTPLKRVEPTQEPEPRDNTNPKSTNSQRTQMVLERRMQPVRPVLRLQPLGRRLNRLRPTIQYRPRVLKLAPEHQLKTLPKRREP